MAKYAFNTSAEKASDVVGIPEQRWKELHAATIKTVTAAFFTDENISNEGEALEMLINEAQPVGEVEAIALGFMYGKAAERTKDMARKMAKLME